MYCEKVYDTSKVAIYAPVIYTGPNPLPLPQVMYMHPSKTLCTGLYKSQVHRLFYAHVGGLGPIL